MRRRLQLDRDALVVGAVLAAVGVGCNTILDNRPGVLDDGTAAGNEAARDNDGDRGRASQGDEARTDSGAAYIGASADDAAADATGCTTGSKTCGDLCVSMEDPYFGCKDPSCAPCTLAHATATCAAGACAVGSCASGFADCNRKAADGCEANLASVTSCGACGVACPHLPHVVMSCVAGECDGVCEAGFADCNAKKADGCEIDLRSDKRNCGTCGMHCGPLRCEQGLCTWP